MILRIDHIGVVVRRTEEAIAVLSNLFGFEASKPSNALEKGFTSTFISKGVVRIELIEPTASEGIIARFLEKRGEGLHHISFEVDDIDQETRSLKAKGAELLSEKPRQVTETARSVFIHPHSGKGVLIELVQRV